MNKKKNAAIHHNPQESNSTQNQSTSESQIHARTRNHMRDLLVASTTAGIGLSAALCSVSCDPLPEPFDWTCSDSADALWNTSKLRPYAVWRFDNNRWTINVTLQLNSPSFPTELSFAANPILTDGNLLASSINKNDVLFVCIPDSSGYNITVEQPMQCSGKLFSISYDLLISDPPVENKRIDFLER